MNSGPDIVLISGFRKHCRLGLPRRHPVSSKATSKSDREDIAHDVDVDEEAAKEEEALLTAAGESPAKEDQAGMRLEEQSQSLAAG